VARERGDFDLAPIYAGQGVSMLHAERSAADVLREFAGAEGLLARAAGRSNTDGPTG
jgi:nitronate monooxygenase